jgi:DcmR-like sensory protein
MPNAVELGVHGIQVALGDHVCGLYAGETQRDQVILPFLEAGLRHGDKCICIVDGVEPSEIVDGLCPGGGDWPGVDNQLDVMRASDVYLRSGLFSAPEIISSWKAAISEVMYDGRFDVVRAVEVWSGREVVPDEEELLFLESEMNRYLPLFPQVIVCLYDLERFGGGLVVDLLKTHPRVLLGGMLLENPYCLEPDELVASSDGDGREALQNEREEAAAWCYSVTTGST